MITREEIAGLMANLLYVDAPPAGATRLTAWASERSSTLGLRYTSELARRMDREAEYGSTDGWGIRILDVVADRAEAVREMLLARARSRGAQTVCARPTLAQGTTVQYVILYRTRGPRRYRAQAQAHP